MSIKIVRTCPLGHTCEKVVGDVIERCMWFKQLQGQDPQTGDPIDTWDCAIAWQPLLMIENSRQSMRVSSTLQEIRNDAVKTRAKLTKVVDNAKIIEA